LHRASSSAVWKVRHHADDPWRQAVGRIARQEAHHVPAKPDLIVFLCPNGHRLNGPASLEGKPGQCPHCGVKFRVPSRDDPVEPDEEEPAMAPGSGSGLQAVDTVEEIPAEEPTFNFKIEEPSRGGSSPSHGLVPPSSNVMSSRSTLADIFTRLWDERERGSVVELYLSSGQVLVPERFARESSRKSYGVFAIRDPDGTYTVTAVNWESVSKVSIRHLPKLPKKMFD
jgi:hypothetical protein